MAINRVLRLWVFFIALALFSPGAPAVEALGVLKTRTETFEKVTLVSRTVTHLFIQHSRGVANVKIAEVDPGALRTLGVIGPEEAAKQAAATSKGQAVADAFKNVASNVSVPKSWKEAWKDKAPVDFRLSAISQNTLLTVLAALLALYLFFCYCAMLICQKSGADSGVLVWLPILQIFPLLRAARMSRWWFLFWFVPIINIVAQVLWCVKIAEARGKGFITAIMLMLPVTNLFAYLYLAFSGSGSSAGDAEYHKPIRIEPLPI